MKKFIALVLVLVCLFGSSACADAYCTWGKVVETDHEGNAIINTLDGHLYAVYDGSLTVGVYLALVLDEGATSAYNDDYVVKYTQVAEDAHPYLKDL